MSGRPSVITDQVVSLLVSSFQSGLTVREACWQSVISHEAYYNRNRSDEQFADTMSKAQSNFNVRAKQVIISAIDKGDIVSAKWWLEHKARAEFGKDGMPDERPEGYFALLRSTEIAIHGLEELICLHYRGILFLESQRQTGVSPRRGQNVTSKADKLLQLTNAELTNYIELEIYATDNDKASVKNGLTKEAQ